MSGTRTIRVQLAAIILVMTATACANSTTSYRTGRFGRDGPAVITQDAKTRNLIMVPERTRALPGQPEGRLSNRYRICAEAAPDVFSAISASAAGELGVNTRGSGSEAQARAAMALAETAATIERTQTINLLRESMYRTCERYLSGAISHSSFVVQAGRDWRAMIAILAIEQLTRTARPPSTIIAGGSTSVGLPNTEEARRGLAAAQTRLEAAREAQSRAAAMPGGDCTTPAAPAAAPATAAAVEAPAFGTTTTTTTTTTGTPASGATAPATTTPAAPSAECTAKLAAKTQADAAFKAATDDVATWTRLLNAGGGQFVASTTQGSQGNSGAGGSGPGETSLRYVATVVNDIVTQAFETDETQLMCIQMLSDTTLQDIGGLRSGCVAYLMTRVENERERLLGDPGVRARSNERRLDTLYTRHLVTTYLGGITEEQFAEDLPIIRQRIPDFCPNLTLRGCRAFVQNQNLDIIRDQELVATVIQTRIDARKTP